LDAREQNMNSLRSIAIRLAGAALGLLAAGCASYPEPKVQQPMTARPRPASQAAAANGAIFQAASYRPLFEDHKARMVGDVLTITITESTSAVKASGNSTSKTGSVSYAAPTVFGVPAVTTGKLAASETSSNKFEDKGAASASNTFTGTITVTVIDVYANGNLLVSGEKQIAFDKGSEFIRFSGVVNPDTIVAGNSVPSTQVADARVEYRTNTHIDKTELMSQLSRFFLSILPM
jgi:flagellar L-ring protein precursor FlgH